MVKSMNREILEKLDEILGLVKDSQDYHDYQFLAKKLEKNQKATKLIADIKKLQKQLVQREAKKEDYSKEEKEIEELLKSLNQIPLYTEFLEKQQELNEIYQLIHTKLEDYFLTIF